MLNEGCLPVYFLHEDAAAVAVLTALLIKTGTVWNDLERPASLMGLLLHPYP